jgi:hypothetical protein
MAIFDAKSIVDKRINTPQCQRQEQKIVCFLVAQPKNKPKIAKNGAFVEAF